MVQTLMLIFLLSMLYFLTGTLSLELLHGNNIINLGVFAPEGIALAFALFFGVRVLPGIFLGQLLLALFNNVNTFAAFEISLINSMEAYIAIVLFNKFKLSKELASLRDIVGIILIILLVLQPFSALLGSMSLYAHEEITMQAFSKTLFSWWFGNIMGQLLFAPFLLLLFARYHRIVLLDYAMYGVAFGFYNYLLIFILGIHNPFLLLILDIPIVIYIVSKKGLICATLMSVIVSIITSISIYNGVIIFGANSNFDNIINYNLFVLLFTLSVLIVGILFEERKHYALNLQTQIVHEVKKNKEQQLMMMQQSRLAQMGEMISMIAHQWRQPLNNLSLVNQLLISQYKKNKLNDDAIEYFKRNSKKQIDLMSTTIDDFRNFFKVEKTKTLFDIQDVIQNILDMTAPIYSSNAIHLKFHRNPDMAYETNGYPNALAQAILNIINNAKDALIEKNKNSDKKIDIFLIKHEETITIEIKDNAGGIPSRIIDKIFDPYFSTKQEKNGTGLGLYMSKMILDEMQASISVSNDPLGAVFTLHIKGEKSAT